MKPKKNRFIATAAAALLLAPAAFALDGTWINTAGGSWSTANPNWAADQIADGAGFTADFSTLDIPADTTVTLDGARTIGNLTFGDTDTTTAGTLFLTNGTEGPLTLDGTTPTITVNALGAGKLANISATLAGTNGFTKTGPGNLILNTATNTISGAVVISEGNIQLNSAALTGATSVAINAGALVLATITHAVTGTISFGGGRLQYNISPVIDYSGQFSTDPNQNYIIRAISGREATYASDLSSPGGTLTKDGPGLLQLAAANTFDGITRLVGGNLVLSHAQALQNSPINTTASADGTATVGFVLSGVTTPTFGGLTGNKNLVSLFDTDLNNDLGGINTYNSVTNLTLNPGTGASYSYAGVIDDGDPGGMTLTKTGEGTQTLTGANNYTGGTILSAGTLGFGNALALGFGDVTFAADSTLQTGGGGLNLANNVIVNSSVTGTLDTNGINTTLSGALTGDGNLIKSGAGNLTLTGGEANALLGAINVNAGRLVSTNGTSFTNMTGPITVASGASFQFSQAFTANDLTNALNLSGPGNDANFGALHIAGNATASGPITLDADTTITKSFNNAFLTGSITGANRNLTLKTTEVSIPAQPGLTISAPIALGTGGITVAAVPVVPGETNIVTLSGNNTYSGETHVVTGELMLTGSARIPDSSTVRIESGAVLNLDFAGTDKVAALYLPGDPNPKPDGTYGAVGSSAFTQSADFVGTGILQVGGATDNFASWAASQVPPVTGGPNGDDNNNGVENLVEYALVDGGERGTLSGNTITFTKRGAPYGSDLTYDIESSIDLVGWGVLAKPPVVEDASSISYTFTPGSPVKEFARLKVVQVP